MVLRTSTMLNMSKVQMMQRLSGEWFRLLPLSCFNHLSSGPSSVWRCCLVWRFGRLFRFRYYVSNRLQFWHPMLVKHGTKHRSTFSDLLGNLLENMASNWVEQ